MNNLPKSWGVYFENSPGLNHPVIEFLNRKESDFGGTCKKCYYGIESNGSPYCTTDGDYFETIITEQQFLNMVNGIEPIIYNVIESVDCEVISLRSSTDETKIVDLFKSLIKEDNTNMFDNVVELCVKNKIYYGESNYKVYLLESKII